MERRLLQVIIAVASIVPLGAGLAGILHGPWLFGAYRYNDDTISQIAYLSGLLFAIGLLAVASIPKIEKYSQRFFMIGTMVFIGGIARLYVGYLTGFGSWPHQAALLMELGITPAIAAWVMSYAKRYPISKS